MRHARVLLFVALAAVPAAQAVTVVIPSGTPRITLRVGSAGLTIDTVTFNIAGTSTADGTPVTGAPTMFVEVTARRAGGPARTYTLSVSSVAPLVNGADTLPFTNFSWTTSDGDIPAGTFNGTATQVLMSFQNNRAISNTHTFVYNNTPVLAPGTYTGQLVYTLSGP